MASGSKASTTVVVSSTAPSTGALATTQYTVVFRLQDAFNNNVLQSGVNVTLTAQVSAGGAGQVLSGNAATTDANGQVIVNWLTGSGAGSTQTLTASALGLTSAVTTTVLAP